MEHVVTSLYILVAAFPQPKHGTIEMAAYDSIGDCWEIADALNDNSDTATFWCEEEQPK